MLEKTVSINATKLPVSRVLTDIGQKGGFFFSYSGKTIAKDSVVTIICNNQTVSKTLTHLFGNRYQYEEHNNYIIITPALKRLSFSNIDVTSDNNNYSISGIIVDESTGERLMNTSIYEKMQLVSTLTDEHGYFKLKMRSARLNEAYLTASKILYRDTSLNILNVDVKLDRKEGTIYQHNNKHVESTALGRFLTTTAQRLQSMNIQNFFANRPYQISLAPGLSSHGSMSSQVINKFSLNLGGGYTAGVNGMEFGGLFNVNKHNTKYLQLAGVFNVVGGNATGFQFAGVSNVVLDTLKGVQISGFINTTNKRVAGLQIAALNNKAHILKGVQIGVVNIADTSGGASIGLINIIRNGFYKISLSANDLSNTNISLKTGTHKFYSSLLFGANITAHNKMYSFGLGVGHDFMFTDHIYLSTEVAYQFSFTGAMDDRWAQAKLLFNVQLAKNVSFVAGPTFNKYSYTGSSEGYQNKFKLPDDYGGYGNPVKRWIGWEAGLALNSVFKPASKLKKTRVSRDLFTGIGTIAGWGWGLPSTYVLGTEGFIQKNFRGSMSATFSAGYVHQHINSDISATSYFTHPNGQVDEYFTVGYQAIPLKAGVRTYTGKRLFFAGELGASLGINKYSILKITYTNGSVDKIQFGRENSFLYAVSAGYSFDNNLEIGIKFEDFANLSHIKQFNLRFAYRFNL
ncbi:hypothetical protein [Pedobacter sp. KLB.chiD]|uniref:hypothetical protein n=1 Tax=Pedobacter sp. KLB.chiD TaxID=3387402 RepID=UPI00399ACAD8